MNPGSSQKPSLDTAESLDQMWQNGFAIRQFTAVDVLDQIADLCRRELAKFCPSDLPDYHKSVTDQELHLKAVAAMTDQINGTTLVDELFRPEADWLRSLYGPDILIQRLPHLRVGRPNEDRDSIDVHRDSFYGSSVWHLNAWYPLIPLPERCGILLAHGTHRQPSRNVQDKSFPDQFRASVEKGSLANRMGFIYRRRTDDTIEALTPADMTLVAPPLGSYVLFFGCMAHGGVNQGDTTRWTMDVRFSKPNDGATTKPDYFREFTRGVISRVAEDFFGR